MGDYSHIPPVPGIYLITCILKGERWYYIGQAKNMQERLYKHERYLMWDHPNKSKQSFKMLQNLWDSNAEFKYSVIEELQSTDSILQYEAYYIQQYRNKYGHRVLNVTGKIKIPPKVHQETVRVVEQKHRLARGVWASIMAISPIPVAVMVIQMDISVFEMSAFWMFVLTYVVGLIISICSYLMVLTVYSNIKENNDGQ